MKNKALAKGLNIVKAMLLPIGIYVFFSIVTHGRFGSLNTTLAILRSSVVPVLLGMGLSFGMSMGMWNFSAGAVVYAAAIFSANLSGALGWRIPGVCVFAILLALAFSAFSGILYNKVRIPCLVLSLGLSMIIEALPNLLAKDFVGKISLKDTYLAASPWCFIIAIVMFAIFYYLNNCTTFGQNIKAIGSNIAIANSAGINIDRVKFTSFMLSGLFFGVTAIVYLSTNVTVTAVTGFQSVGLIYDSMMGVFIASVLAKYINYSVSVIIGIITIRMLGTGLVACGMSSELRGLMTGVFLFIVLTYSANQGLLDRIKRRKACAQEANEQYRTMTTHS